jgi:fucose 4-O-acetylase-like acetyltransferase
MIAWASSATLAFWILPRIPGLVLAVQIIAVPFMIAISSVAAQSRPAGLLAGLGQRTLPVYVMHTLIISVTVGLIRLMHVSGAAFSAVGSILIAAAAIATSLTIWKVLRERARFLFAPPPLRLIQSSRG